MIWTILLWILLSLILFLILLLLLPFNCDVDIAYASTENRLRKGQVILSWIHPLICAGLYDFEKGFFTFSIFGHTFKNKVTGQEEQKEELYHDIDQSARAHEATGKQQDEKVKKQPEERRVQEMPESISEPVEKPTPEAEKGAPGTEEKNKSAAPPEGMGEIRHVPPPLQNETLAVPSPAPSREKIKTMPPPPATDEQRKSPPLTREKKKTLLERWNMLKDRITANKYFYILRRKKFRGKVFRWIMRILRTLFFIVKFDRFHLHTRFGLEDPAAMGRFFGMFMALKKGLFTAKRHGPDIILEPVFMESVLDIDTGISIHASPARLLTPVAMAVLTFPYLSTLILWLRVRRLKAGEMK